MQKPVSCVLVNRWGQPRAFVASQLSESLTVVGVTTLSPSNDLRNMDQQLSHHLASDHLRENEFGLRAKGVTLIKGQVVVALQTITLDRYMQTLEKA